MTTQPINREQWLTQACNIILADIIEPHAITTHPAPTADFKISIGFPRSNRSKTLAECYVLEASSSHNTNEIFINPTIAEPLPVLEVLVHELIHYWDNCESGHKGFFARVARAVGLEGKLTATIAGHALREQLKESVIAVLPDFPHDAMDLSNERIKRQKNRNLKCECSHCHFTFRASRTQLARLTEESYCPACDTQNSLVIES